MSAPDSRRLFRRAVWTVAFLCGSSLTIASATAGHGDRPNTDTAVAHELAVTTDAAPMVGLAASADGHGYWIAAADGHVWNYGDAPALGGVHTALQRPIVGMAATPDAHGYWLVASDGGIFSFGDARFYGSTGAMHLNRPIVGMARTASGHGYWLVARDGGLFTFGDARFHGSLGGTPPGSPIVGMAATRDRAGYWMVSDAGGVYAFGSATPHGEIIKDAYPRGVEALVPTGDENGYWLLTARGAVLGFGDASWYGSIVRPRRHPIGLTHLRLYGDSLVTQADPDFHFQIEDSGYSLQDANFIGAALCDALPDMYGTRRSVPDEVVLAFSGNTRPCLPAGAATDGDVFVDGYRHASEQAVAAFAAEGTMVVFALPPPRLDNPATAYLPGVYKDVAQQWPELARAYDAGANVAGPNNTWVATLPCLPFETASMGCTNGNIAVRAPDKLHFCPGGLADPNNIWSGCALWSSGSWRYAMGLFHAAQTGRP